MFNKLIIVLLAICPFILFSQSSITSKFQQKKKASIYEAPQALNRSSFIDHFRFEFNLNEADDFDFERTLKTKNGWQRHHYLQNYKGLSVLGSKITLHEKNGNIVRSSGDLFPQIAVDINDKLNENQIKNILIDQVIRKAGEEKLKLDPKDVRVSAIDLVIMDRSYPKFSGNYILAYDITAEYDGFKPHKSQYLLGAKSGKLVTSFTKIHSCGVTGTANTHYYGEQDIETTAVEATNEEDAHFVMLDETRGIATVNELKPDPESEYGYELFKDDDNYWDNANELRDEVAGDAHYCSAAYYDYMKAHFDWIGLDGLGAEMSTVIHARGKFYVNAFWNGSQVFIGNGDCKDYGPLSTLSIVGHEYAHAFTDFTSDLIYQDESGALNESISDIIGKALEHAYDPDNFSWELDPRIITSPEATLFRSMSNPNDRFDPKYYKGQFWYEGTSDRGGVHTNSGVFNYWYYLLVEGVADTNEVGYSFNVNALGFDVATDIVYGTQVAYFTTDTDYPEAKVMTLQYVADTYGINSTEYNAVTEAWNAVGVFEFPDAYEISVGIDTENDDLYLCKDDCKAVIASISNLGNVPVPVGTVIYLRYINDFTLESDDLAYTLVNELLPTEEIQVPFEKLLCHTDQNSVGNLDFISLEWSENNIDFNQVTNSIFVNYIEGEDGLELELTDIELLPFRCDNEFLTLNLSVSVTGCEAFPANEPLNFEIELENGVSQTTTFTSSAEILPGRFRTFNYLLTPSFTNEENLTFTASIYSGLDNSPMNNTFSGIVPYIKSMQEGDLETFDDATSNAGEYLSVDPGIFARSSQIEYQGDNYLAIYTDGRSDFFFDDCDSPEDVFLSGFDFFLSRMTVCFDATEIEDPVLNFDMIPFYTDEILDFDSDHTSMVKVLVPGADRYEQNVITNLPEGVKQNFEFDLPKEEGIIEIEVLTMLGNEEEVFNGILEFSDVVLFDNIEIGEKITSSIDDLNQRSSIKVYPNPATDQVTFEFDKEISELKIISVDGRLIERRKNLEKSYIWDIPFSLNGLILFETIDVDGNKRAGKIVVQ